MALVLAGVTGRIIGAAIEVHVEVPIVYRGRVEAGKRRLDLLVEKMIVVDLKAISELMDIHFAVVRSQLRAVGLKHGLLLNFAQVTLQAKRLIV